MRFRFFPRVVGGFGEGFTACANQILMHEEFLRAKVGVAH